MANSKRKCPNCGKYNRLSEGILVKDRLYCNLEGAIAYGKKNAPKGKIKKHKAERRKHAKRKREFYDKDVKTRREAAVYWFNRFIRLRDRGNPCISCGTTNPDIKYDAGHFIPAGSCSALRFSERNVHLQCSLNCNQHLSGNRAEYRKSLVRLYEEDVVLEMEGPQPTIKITAEWYKSIEDTYKAKCKEIEND